MSQYNKNYLQNKCDLSQSHASISYRGSNLNLLPRESIAANTVVHAVRAIKNKIQYQAPRATITLAVSASYLDERDMLAAGYLPPVLASGRLDVLTPIEVDAITLPTTRHVTNICETRNTLTLDGKTYTKKSQIVDETSSYSSFQPNEKTLLLPLVIRSFETVCKTHDLFAFERHQQATLKRGLRRTTSSVNDFHSFFDKKVPSPSKYRPIPPYLASPPPFPFSRWKGGVGYQEYYSQDARLQYEKLMAHYGLSNVPYLTAPLTDANLKPKKTLSLEHTRKLELTKKLFTEKVKNKKLKPDQYLYLAYDKQPSGVKLRVESEKSKLSRQWDKQKEIKKSVGSTGKGDVHEFSKKSRLNLVGKLTNMEKGLPERGIAPIIPTHMLTLTYPDILRLGLDGLREKKHLDRMRKRIFRWFESRSLPSPSALRILEYQENREHTPPHYHVTFWNVQCFIDDYDLFKEFQVWVLKSWADIVKHPDPVERAKHEKAGTSFEKLKHQNFAYSKSYMAKKEQKRPPDYVKKTGHYWSFWNYKPEDYSDVQTYKCKKEELISLIENVLVLHLHDKSPRHAQRVIAGLRDRFNHDVSLGSFTTTIFGGAAADAIEKIAHTTDVHSLIPDDQVLSVGYELVHQMIDPDEDLQEWLVERKDDLLDMILNYLH